jgi:hypothetical protein
MTVKGGLGPSQAGGPSDHPLRSGGRSVSPEAAGRPIKSDPGVEVLE